MSPEAEVIFSTMILAISVTALAQFALYYWRAVLAGVAAQPVSERTLAAAGLNSGGVTADAFATLASLHELTPELKSGGGLGLVRMYYCFVGAQLSLLGASAKERSARGMPPCSSTAAWKPASPWPPPSATTKLPLPG